jgi:hypothetical protein
VPQRKLACESCDKVQADREDDIDAYRHERYLKVSTEDISPYQHLYRNPLRRNRLRHGVIGYAQVIINANWYNHTHNAKSNYRLCTIIDFGVIGYAIVKET